MKTRNLLMKSLAADPRFTLEAIGGFFGLTRERVRQVVGNGVSRCPTTVRRRFCPSRPSRSDVAMMRELNGLGLDQLRSAWVLGFSIYGDRGARWMGGIRPRGGVGFVDQVREATRRALMAQAMADGATDTEIKELFDCSRVALTRMRRRGILPRNPNLGSVAWEGRPRREAP